MAELGTVESLIEPFVEKVATQRVEALEAKGGLMMPKEVCIRKQKDQLIETFYHEVLALQNSMDLAGKIIRKHLDLIACSEQKKIGKEIEEASKEVFHLMQNPSTLINEKRSLQKILKMSDAAVLWIYEIGYESFIKNKYEEACAIFQFLVILNSFVCDYWVALGQAQRRLGLESKALNSFLIACELNDKHLISKYNLAETFFDTGYIEEAEAQLRGLFILIKEEKRQDLLSSAQMLKDKIQSAKK